MVKVLSPKLRLMRRIVCLSFGLALSFAFLWIGQAAGQDAKKGTAPAKAAAPAASTKKGTAKVAPPAAKPDAAKKGDAAAADGEDQDDAPDPIQTRKDNPTEVFRDPRAEALLDVNKFPEVKLSGNRPLNPVDLESFRRMAGDPNSTIEEALIQRVVDAQVAQLTDHKNIQALVDPPKDQNVNSQTAKAIQNATSLLLEAVYTSRSAKNNRFIDLYYRTLLAKLGPVVVRNHLIPRVQAMIILGQTGNPQALRFYLDQIKNPEQTALVKIWALKGISNIKKFGRAALSADVEINAAKVVAALLDTDKNLPWPAQLRALEVLGDLRQGHSAADPKKLEMANVAMRFLVDPKAKLEVRAEAARALGLMNISTAIPNYNYEGIAYTTGEVAAELGDQIGKIFTDNPSRSEYYAAFLIGPLLEAFEGAGTPREGGLIKSTTGPAQQKIEELVNLIRPIMKTSIELTRVGRGQVAPKQTELAALVTALQENLKKNAPKDRRLIPDGAELPVAGGAGGQN